MLQKLLTNPEANDKSEKSNVAGKRIFLLEPIRSEMEPNTNPEAAQQIAKTETISPIWVLERGDLSQ